VVASFVLRWALNESVGGTSIYGPLATPIVVLIWLYFLAIAVLIGAALNAAIDERWPTPDRVEARALVRERNGDQVVPEVLPEAEPIGAATLTPLDPRSAYDFAYDEQVDERFAEPLREQSAEPLGERFAEPFQEPLEGDERVR